MHETTQRLLCRVAFLVFCLVPTLAVASSLAWQRWTPVIGLSKPVWQQRISRQLGLTVSIDRVSTAEDGVTLLSGIRLADPETGQPVGKAQAIEVTSVAGRLVLAVSMAELRADRLPRLSRRLYERICQGKLGVPGPVQLVAGQLTLHDLHGASPSWKVAQTLSDVHCLLDPRDQQTMALVRFRLAGTEADPAELQITRDRREQPPATEWRFDTGSAGIPCGLLAAYMPNAPALGDPAMFCGTVRATDSAGRWDGEVSGRFDQVDLEHLVTAHFPHKLSGRGQLTLRQATVRDGRLVDAAGSLIAQQGAVSRSMLDAAAAYLALARSQRLTQLQTNVLPYEKLAVGFTIRAGGLVLAGLVDGQGTVLADAAGPLLLDKSADPLPVVALVRALAPQSDIQVPASKETELLLRALPLPPVIPPTNGSPRAPYFPVRMQPSDGAQ